MDTRLTGVPEGGSGDFDIFLYRAAKPADGGVLDDAGYFFDGMEIAGAGHREACFDDVNAKGLQLEGQLDLFVGIELAPGDLLAVTKRGVENENFLIGHMDF